MLFVAVAATVSCAVGFRTRRLSQGLLAAVWSLVLGAVLWSAGFLMMNYAFWGTNRPPPRRNP